MPEPSPTSLYKSMQEIENKIIKLTGGYDVDFFMRGRRNLKDRVYSDITIKHNFKDGSQISKLLDEYAEYMTLSRQMFNRAFFKNPLHNMDEPLLSEKDYNNILKNLAIKLAIGNGVSAAAAGGLYYGLNNKTKTNEKSIPMATSIYTNTNTNIGKYATAAVTGVLGGLSTYELLKLVDKYLDNKYKKCGNSETCKAKIDKIRNSIKTRSSAFKFISSVGIGAIAAAAGYKFGDKAYNNIINKFNNKS